MSFLALLSQKEPRRIDELIGLRILLPRPESTLSLKISKSTAYRAIRRLVELGLIRRAEYDEARYRLSYWISDRARAEEYLYRRTREVWPPYAVVDPLRKRINVARTLNCLNKLLKAKEMRGRVKAFYDEYVRETPYGPIAVRIMDSDQAELIMLAYNDYGYLKLVQSEKRRIGMNGRSEMDNS